MEPAIYWIPSVIQLKERKEYRILQYVKRVRVNENIKERRENLCSFMIFGRIL
jgi:hypothetical protein